MENVLKQEDTLEKSPVKILAVDDREDNLLSIETILEQESYTYFPPPSVSESVMNTAFPLPIPSPEEVPVFGASSSEHSSENVITINSESDYSQSAEYSDTQAGTISQAQPKVSDNNTERKIASAAAFGLLIAAGAMTVIKKPKENEQPPKGKHL